MDYLLAALAALAAWWSSTAVILYRSGKPATTYGRTFIGATVVLVFGIAALAASRTDTSAMGACLGFLGALAVFGWHEVSYLFGFVTGPRPEPCPPDCDGWRRFVFGVKTCIYHELAVIATVILVALLMTGAANQVGLWTLVVLWLMRWSAKLNIFLGVQNLHVEFWPEHLAYLTSYARQRSMNSLFPFSIILASGAVAVLVVSAINSAPGSGDRVGAVLLATLLGLATVEHWFLILRIPDELLWRPALKSRRSLDAGMATPGLGRESC